VLLAVQIPLKEARAEVAAAVAQLRLLAMEAAA
jgi:hypothetical protein